MSQSCVVCFKNDTDLLYEFETKRFICEKCKKEESAAKYVDMHATECDECGKQSNMFWRVERNGPDNAKNIRYKCAKCVKDLNIPISYSVAVKPPRIIVEWYRGACDERSKARKRYMGRYTYA